MSGYFDGMSCDGVIASFRVNADEYGWLGNMSAFSVNYEGVGYPTAEHLFQALRFAPDQRLPLGLDEPATSVREYLRQIPSPIAMKMKARSNALAAVRMVEPMSDEDVTNMKMVVKLKIEQNDIIRRKLIWLPKDCAIIEDIGNRKSTRHLFWGARKEKSPQGMVWGGSNTLGKIWEELRVELGLIRPTA